MRREPNGKLRWELSRQKHYGHTVKYRCGFFYPQDILSADTVCSRRKILRSIWSLGNCLNKRNRSFPINGNTPVFCICAHICIACQVSMVDAGQISTVNVKDMSRIGRNYLEVGMYTDIKFPKTYYYKVRGVRVVDGVKVYTKWSTNAHRIVK